MSAYYLNMANQDAEKTMTSADWLNLARLCAIEIRQHEDDPSVVEAFEALEAKCRLRCAAAREGRQIP